MNCRTKRFALLIGFLALPLKAAIVKDIDFPDKLKHAGSELLLNGTAVRKATWLKINVYAAGLYTDKKTGIAEDLLAAKTPRLLRMHFLRDVDADKIRETWDESFAANCEKECEDGKAKLAQLKKVMPDVKKGDVLSCSFDAKGVKVDINGKSLASIDGAVFQRNLLSNWLGKNPPDQGVKDGLLGKPKP